MNASQVRSRRAQTRDVLAGSIAAIVFASNVALAADASMAMPSLPSRLSLDLAHERAAAQRAWDRQQQRLGLGLIAPRPAGTVPVTSCADDGSDGTLRSVVAQAVSGDVVDLSTLTCSTITLTQGAIVSQVDGLTVQGPGIGALTIDADSSGGVFYANDAATFVVRDLSMTNGYVVDGWGGCIRNVFGGVSVDHVAISGCVAHQATTYHASHFGGAVMAYRDISVADSTISGNTLSSEVLMPYPYTLEVAGGAIFAMWGEISVMRSSMTGNHLITTAVGPTIARGGAIGTSGYAVNLGGSVIAHNLVSSAAMESGPDDTCAVHGGGVDSVGYMSSSGSTIDGNVLAAPNTTHACGGGIYLQGSFVAVDTTVAANISSGVSGGMHAHAALHLLDTTISGNRSHDGAGGLYGVQPFLSSVTIAFNRSELGSGGIEAFDGATLHSAIIANNTGGPGEAGDIGSIGGTLTGDHNLVMDAGDLALPSDTLRSDPMLAPLTDNGGPTQTHALANASPAIDAGSNEDSLLYDQRNDGFPRIFGPAADIGAFELQVAGDEIFANGFDATTVD